jgi:hypothetical protein
LGRRRDELMKPNTDKLEVKLRDGGSNPYYKKVIDINNDRQKDELADDLWNVASVELTPKHKRKKKLLIPKDLIGGGRFF